MGNRTDQRKNMQRDSSSRRRFLQVSAAAAGATVIGGPQVLSGAEAGSTAAKASSISTGRLASAPEAESTAQMTPTLRIQGKRRLIILLPLRLLTCENLLRLFLVEGWASTESSKSSERGRSTTSLKTNVVYRLFFRSKRQTKSGSSSSSIWRSVHEYSQLLPSMTFT